DHQAFFAQAKSVKPKVNVLYTHQSMWAEKYLHVGHSQLEGRNIGASIKSALSFYQAFHEIGISVGLGEMNEYDWNRANYHGEILVLANQFAISEENWDLLKSFVAKGGFLFLEGLSGMYNEHLFNRFQKSDKYADFLGAEVAEFLTVADAFELEFEGHSLPAHLWKGELLVSDKLTTFHRQTYGKGKVTWIPSSIGLGARKSDFEPLANLLLEEMESHQTQDIGWKKYHPNMVVRRLQANRDLVEIFINKSDVVQEIQIPVAGKRSIIFGNKDALSKKSFLTIFPEEVVVVLSEDFF
ncbi:MAG: beta-galactosidase trimerization domain-containing protein, partial [Cyclobacteriaceae bacterium]